MFYATKQNKYIVEGTAFELDGVQYPAVWLNLSTPEQKAQLGLEEVVATNQKANEAYYWVSEQLEGATLTYINTPKNLDDLKVSQASMVRACAYSYLFPSDWMVVKATETGEPLDSLWKAYRSAVRITANEAVTAIEAAVDVPALEAIVIDWPKDPNWKEPVEEVTAPVEETVETTTEQPV